MTLLILCVTIMAHFTSCIASIPLVSNLSLDDKIGQLFIVGVEPHPAIDHPFRDPIYVKNLVNTHHLGGIIFFQGFSPQEQYEYTRALQLSSKTPLFIAQDAEWGPAMRHPSIEPFPLAMTLGALDEQDDHLIYAMGKVIGTQCAALGININLAPVVDVNTNPANPIINTRSFGENPHKVARKATLYMKGMQHTILTCAKHFPGHGDTNTDSHYAIPIIHRNTNNLMTNEILPFTTLIHNNIDAIMVGHIAVPKLSNQAIIPATLSHEIITDLLQKKLAYNGLIITDALDMKGITTYNTPEEISFQALLAGADILLCPENVPAAIAHIKQALKHNKLSQTDIDHRVQKILNTKQRISNTTSSIYDTHSIDPTNTSPLQHSLYQAAITLAANHNHTLPLHKTDFPIPIITIGTATNTPFIDAIQQQLEITPYHLPAQASLTTCTTLAATITTPLIIIAIHIDSRSGLIETTTNDNAISWPPFITMINQLGPRAIIVLFANPYNLKHFPHASAIIVGYENKTAAQQAAAGEGAFRRVGGHSQNRRER